MGAARADFVHVYICADIPTPRNTRAIGVKDDRGKDAMPLLQDDAASHVKGSRPFPQQRHTT